ncbi:MAG: AI-2E family transporter [Lachnospiraceae bacterium]
MELNKKNILKLSCIIGGAIAFCWALQNPAMLLSAIGQVFSLFFPFVLGLCIAFVLNLPMGFLERHLFVTGNNKVLKKLKRPLCLLLSLAFVFGILTLVICLVVPELINTAKILANAVPAFLDKVQVWAMKHSDLFPQIETYLTGLDLNWGEISKSAVSFLTSGATSILGGTVNFVTALVGGITNLILGFIFALYILLDKQGLERRTKLVFTAVFPEKIYTKIFFVTNLTKHTFSKFVTGQCVEACILGSLCWIGMLIFRFPYAPMIGVLVGMTALIPIVGALIGTVVGAFMIMMIHPIQALWFIVFLLILQQIEGNLIYPRVVGSSVGLPPIWVLAAVTIGGGLSGIIGMLFAVPIASVLYTLVKIGVKHRLG